MNCYLCSATNFVPRKGQVRDAPEIKILECRSCGLVMLSSQEKIRLGFYEDSGGTGVSMQLRNDSGVIEETPLSMESWLRETEMDDQRRFDLLKSIIPNQKVLDFGCGNGGFLLKAKTLATEIIGIELEKRVLEYWKGILKIVSSIEKAEGKYDLITSFHVIEHLADPKVVLSELVGHMAPKGRIIIEVPSSEDALLTLYDNDDFQRFSYWSQHLFLFNTNTLNILAQQVGLKVVSIQQYQRYSLSNHLYWLSRGEPGGHKKWGFLDSPLLNEAYSNSLAKIGKSDTLIGHFKKND